MAGILLLHGWDWEKYPVFNPEHQWQNRQEFLAEMQERYEVDYPSMPGFDPADRNRTGRWTLDDYADWLQERMVRRHYDAIVGYSFGCAVATHWQYRHRNQSVPLVLVSPAISRAYRQSPNKILSTVAGLVKRLGMTRLDDSLRRLYLARVVKNPHVVHGSRFLGMTYSNIVSVDLSDELAQLVDADYPVTCVFGGEDTATPPEVLFARVPAARPLSLLIPGGTHDIGSTHPREIAAHIAGFLDRLEAPRENRHR